MITNSGANDALLKLLYAFGVRNSNRLIITSYDKVLAAMKNHMAVHHLDTAPGSVLATLLEAVAVGIVSK